jgi:hypothetical protein
MVIGETVKVHSVRSIGVLGCCTSNSNNASLWEQYRYTSTWALSATWRMVAYFLILIRRNFVITKFITVLMNELIVLRSEASEKKRN